MPPLPQSPVVRATRRLRILLVKPKPRLRLVTALHRFQFLEPIELGYLAAAAGPGHEVRILDLRHARFPRLTLGRALRSLQPDLVGITGYTHEAGIVREIASAVREIAPRARIVVGGHHATVAPEDYDLPSIDGVVRGEGCGPFRRIVEQLARGGDVGAAEGVLVPGKMDEASLRAFPPFPDPSTLPPPRRDLWDPRRYFSVWPSESGPAMAPLFPATSMVRTSFGCRMRCSFCIVPKLFDGKHHARPADAVAGEIAALPNDHVYFCDDENFIDAGFAHELADALERRGVRKRYFAWTRATTVNRHPDLFQRWRALGLDAAFLGFEFATDEELRQSRKGSTVAENARAHDALRAAGVAVHAAFMLRPEFGEDDFTRLAACVDAMPPAQFSFTVCTPSPGTDDYEAMRGRIWVGDAHALHDCMHPLTPTRLPLRRFSQLYARQVHEAGRKNPRRANRRPVRVGEIPHLVHAQLSYDRAFASMYRDFPRDLWDDPR